MSQSLCLCFCLSSPTPIGDPGKERIQGRCAVVGAASHAARRGRFPPSPCQERGLRRHRGRKRGREAEGHEMPPLQRRGPRGHSRARLRKRGREADGRRHEMPPLQRRGRGRNPACSFCHSERSACPESFEGKNLSLNNRTPGKADSFLRQTLRKTQGVLRTGARSFASLRTSSE